MGWGAKQFGRATSENVGKPFAIVLDDKVVSAPRINEPILGGSAVISGGFDVAGAQDLALLLRAGALPAPLDILEERSVGPDLGADSIAAGEIAGIIGIIAVAVFMILSYGLFGIIADVALAMNIFLIMAVLSVLGATLTLPGIAGIVLTIGMAVDANVLIFERIREEIRVGKSPLNAVEVGFWARLHDDYRCQCDDRYRRRHPVCHGLWTGQGLRGDVADRDYQFNVYGDYAFADADFLLDAAQASENA